MRSFFFARSAQLPPMPRDPIDCAADLSSLRQRITELVARNAVSMVQQAIDAVKEEGQYQAIKYLFEMIGLYPAATDDESRPKVRSRRHCWIIWESAELRTRKQRRKKSHAGIP